MNTIEKIAREKLGFDSLRPGQKEAVQSLLEGRDTLTVQPTGSGKSAIYQIAGLMIEGSTVVVSPLIALQKDQADSIVRQGAAEGAVINSAQKAGELRERMERVREGGVEYIFLAPEQLRKEETIEALKEAGVSLFVVDEAHCVSMWGHDFRPDYLRLGAAIDNLGHPRVLALTATASQRVRDEIVGRLHMRDPLVLAQGFDRPNIYLRVDRFEGESEKRDALAHRVRWSEGSGIVYTGTRRAAEEIMRALENEGISSLFYHGGMKATERQEVQDRFMKGEGRVMVATNAFGMGIDKPDIRFVYHYHAPDSLDSYYQEIGRAGRDGEKAEAVLFYRSQDIGSQSYKTSRGRVDPQALNRVIDTLAEAEEPIAARELAEEAGISPRKAVSALQSLEDAGAAETSSEGAVRLVDEADPEEAARTIVEETEERREANRERLSQMRDYAEASVCRRETLLRYFGDSFRGPCGFCDVCQAEDSAAGTRREVVE